MNILTDKINEIARKGLYQDRIDKLRELGIKLSEDQQRALIAFNENLISKVQQRFGEEIKTEGLEEFFNDIMPKIHGLARIAFIETASEYRANKDWDGYGAALWLQGMCGIQ